MPGGCCGIMLWVKGEFYQHPDMAQGDLICRDCYDDPKVKKYDPDVYTIDGYKRSETEIDYSFHGGFYKGRTILKKRAEQLQLAL